MFAFFRLGEEKDRALAELAQEKEAFEQNCRDVVRQKEEFERRAQEVELHKSTFEQQSQELAMQRNAVEQCSKELALQKEKYEQRSKELAKQKETFQQRSKELEEQKDKLQVDRKGTLYYLTLKTSDAGIPALRKLPSGVGCQYTGFAQTSLWRRKPVYRRHGMSTPGVERRYTGFVF